MTNENILHIKRGVMMQMSTEILTFLGTPINQARSVSDSLVQAQESGHASHGIIRLSEYSENVSKGNIDPTASAHVISEERSSVVVDGQWGWGQLASKFAIEIAKKKAREFGTCIVTIKNCNHIGRLGEYVETLANESLISLMWCNAEPAVAAFGGRERTLGTNPFAAGIPKSGKPIVIDFATASVAEGKLRVARSQKEQIKAGLILDKDGNSSTNPNDFYEGGVLLPFGEHKGYCLSLMIELLGGALSGNHPSTSAKYRAGNGAVILAIDPTKLLPYSDYLTDVEEATQHVRNSLAIDPANPIQLPGDAENAFKIRNESAIEVSKTIWKIVNELHKRLEGSTY